MPSAHPPKPASKAKPAGRLRRKRWTILGIAIVALALVSTVYYQFSYVSGTELNTRTWELRAFSFHRDPFTNTQLTGLVHDRPSGFHRAWTNAKKSSVVDRTIRTHLNVQAVQRWDVIRISQSGVSGPAQILVDLLDSADQDNRVFWSAWSKSNPTQAAKLWPAVQTIACLGQYERLPNLLELALVKSQAAQFDSAIDQFMVAELEKVAREFDVRRDAAGQREIARAGLEYGNSKIFEDILNSAVPESNVEDSVESQAESTESEAYDDLL